VDTWRNVPDPETGEVREYEALDDFLEGRFEDFDLETFVFLIGAAGTRETVQAQFALLEPINQDRHRHRYTGTKQTKH